MRVLHVAECWLAGVATATTGWIDATPQLEHVVLARGRPAVPEQTAARPVGADWIELPLGSVRSARALASTIRSLRPDVVHAHSSRAGALVRTGRVPAIVYSPHGFAFMRTDLSPGWRRLIRHTEAALARRHQTIVACAEHERALAERLGARHVVVVPYALPGHQPEISQGRTGGPATVALMGRLCAQKGVGFAAEVAEELRARQASVDVLWIGGGDDELASRLDAAGVHVTGWLDRRAALGLLAAAQVYVHTAEWEGCPLSVLEALAAGVPVVARALPALDGLPVRQQRDPTSMAEAIIDLLDRPSDCASREPSWTNRPDEVGSRLVEVYLRAAGA